MVDLDSLTILICNCSFIQNSAQNGGALKLYWNFKLDLINSQFIDNRASIQGGAIDFDDPSTSFFQGIKPAFFLRRL